MPFRIERNDITKIKADAIVNAANESLLGGGGVDGAIHAAAGPGLLDECRLLGGCKTGEAKLTKGYNLPAKYVIHTVGPVWGCPDCENLLRSCYRKSLELAAKTGIESIAFPLISAGAYRCPKDTAFKVAREEILGFLKTGDMDVTLVLFDRDSLRIPEKELETVKSYIDDRYVKIKERKFGRRRNADFTADEDDAVMAMPSFNACAAELSTAGKIPRALSKASKKQTAGEFTVDESFSEMLLRLIDEKGITDSECYYKANRDRKLFSKIRTNKYYKPSKETAIAFALSLELGLDKAAELIGKAGFSLSDSILSDVIVKYCIENKKFNIIDVNILLFHYDQKLL